MLSFKRINSSALSELLVHRKIHIISIILLGLAGFTYFNTEMEKGSDIELYWLSLFFFFTSLVPLYFTCINVFKDMHDVPSADVQMALPLSASERFLARLMTICYSWVFPFVFSSAAGNIISVLINRMRDSYYFESAEISEMFCTNLKVFLCGLSIALFLIGITVLCSCCIGAKAESIYLPPVLMAVVSLLPFGTVEFMSDRFCSVYTNYLSYDFLRVIGFCAPATFESDEPFSVIYILINCFLSLCILLISMAAYKKRDAATVGYPVVFTIFFEGLMLMALTSAFLLAHSDYYGVSVIGLFIIFVGSLILRMIVSRKDITFLKTVKWTGIFAVYYTAFILVSYAACITGCFGLADRKTDFSEIPAGSSFTVNVSCRNDKFKNLNEKDIYISEEKAEEVINICSKYFKIQNHTPGYFSSIMFSGKEELSSNSVWIRYKDPAREHESTLYSSSLRLSTDDSMNLYKELMFLVQ